MFVLDEVLDHYEIWFLLLRTAVFFLLKDWSGPILNMLCYSNTWSPALMLNFPSLNFAFIRQLFSPELFSDFKQKVIKQEVAFFCLYSRGITPEFLVIISMSNIQVFLHIWLLELFLGLFTSGDISFLIKIFKHQGNVA